MRSCARDRRSWSGCRKSFGRRDKEARCGSCWRQFCLRRLCFARKLIAIFCFHEPDPSQGSYQVLTASLSVKRASSTRTAAEKPFKRTLRVSSIFIRGHRRLYYERSVIEAGGCELPTSRTRQSSSSPRIRTCKSPRAATSTRLTLDSLIGYSTAFVFSPSSARVHAL